MYIPHIQLLPEESCISGILIPGVSIKLMPEAVEWMLSLIVPTVVAEDSAELS